MLDYREERNSLYHNRNHTGPVLSEMLAFLTIKVSDLHVFITGKQCDRLLHCILDSNFYESINSCEVGYQEILDTIQDNGYNLR